MTMSAGGENNRQQTVMIVDDDSVAVDIFSQILQSHGYRVRVASDAEAGLRDLQTVADVPAALLLDLHLPMADGVEFLRQFRAKAPLARLPITVVTGDYFIDEETTSEIARLGARVHFKPLWADDLLTLVEKMVAGALPPA